MTTPPPLGGQTTAPSTTVPNVLADFMSYLNSAINYNGASYWANYQTVAAELEQVINTTRVMCALLTSHVSHVYCT